MAVVNAGMMVVVQELLTQTRRGQVNDPRNVAVFLVRKKCGLPLQEIGDEFGLHKYSSVSSIVSRMEQQISKSPQLRGRVE